MNQIRARFAPSPTGYLHVGSARTALFNWLFARANKGSFILRIEDTDKERSDSKYLDEILASLKWLGLDWDEEPYFQSKRFPLYKEAAERLVKEEKAYYEETDKGKAIRLKVPKDETIFFYDVIHNKIEVNSSTLDDLVLIKSDNTPTYNFACVVDDVDMRMTHIIRGDDHIANTPKQILIYRALGATPPKFAHIPLILGEDKSRMSKRHGATSIGEYRSRGYWPEALVNFLALMGWSPKDNREKLNINKVVELFSLKAIVKTGAVFNIKKLDWLNAEYIKDKPVGELSNFVAGHLIERGILKQDYDRQWFEAVIKCFQTRFFNIDDLIIQASYIFKDDVEFEPEAVAAYLKAEGVIVNLKKLKDKIRALKEFSPASIEEAVRSLVAELNIKSGELIHPARVALTGRSAAPGIFDVIYLIGRERVVKRLEEVKDIE